MRDSVTYRCASMLLVLLAASGCAGTAPTGESPPEPGLIHCLGGSTPEAEKSRALTLRWGECERKAPQRAVILIRWPRQPRPSEAGVV